MIDIKGAMPKKTEELFLEMSEIEDLKVFTLIGGTALSIHLKHRTSEDLDFFINKNIINRELQRKVDNILSVLTGNGNSVETDDIDEYQQDYRINGVKVTFCTTSLLNLKNNVESFLNIDIASQELIYAMKMYTVLKYRIKSRDFYDIKELIDNNSSFEKALDILKKYFPKYNITEKLITNRFCITKLNYDDEGFETLNLKKQETFESLREYFIDIIEKLIDDSEKLILNIQDNTDNLIGDEKFGLLRKSLLMETIERYQIELFNNILDLKIVDIGYIDLSGKTIFNYLFDNQELFDKCLYFTDNISEGLVESLQKENDTQELINIVDYHKILNRCIDKSINKIDEIIADKINKKDIDKFLIDLSIKRKNII
jgi:predicted nucleotidyltransferase component of viral defense system